MCCPLVFEFSVGIRVFVIGLGQIAFFFSLRLHRGKIEQIAVRSIDDCSLNLCTNQDVAHYQ